MKVAVIQMNCVTYDKKRNFDIAGNLIDIAGKQGAKLIVLPELFNTGYSCTEQDMSLSEYPEGETSRFLAEYAQKYSCTLVGGFVERSNVDGLVYNSVMLVDASGILGVYRKMYLWGPEKNRFLKGKDLLVCKTDNVGVAPQICYELGFSENAKILALNGADILVYPSAFGKARYYAWDINSKARAVETGCYVIASNHSKSEGGIDFCGCSRIVDPLGNVLCETTKDNDVVLADIDLELVYEQRNALPYLRDIDTEFISEEYRKIKK